MKLSHYFAAALVAVATMMASNANAAMYNITGDFSGYNVNVTLTTANTLDAVGGYDITGITGTIGGYGTIASLYNNTNQPNVTYMPSGDVGPGFDIDNVFFPKADPKLDWWGVGFQMTSGVYANLFGGNWLTGDQKAKIYSLVSGDWKVDAVSNIKVSEVPLPAGLLLFGSGIASLAGFTAKKKVRV